MSSVVISGDSSGSITLSAPAVAGSSTQTLAAVTGTLAPIVSGTAVNASGTSVDFTGIPSWVKRITVMVSGVSTNGSSGLLLQIGSGSITSSGYDSGAWFANSSNAASTSGYLLTALSTPAATYSGICTLALINTSNRWVASGTFGQSTNPTGIGSGMIFGGNIALGGTLDRIRITTVNGTDTFDAGSINILYE